MRRRSPRATARARELLRALDITRPDAIDVELIAAHLGLVLCEGSLPGGCEGRLVRRGAHGVVVIAVRAFGSKKWRFVAAHEIGHFLLDPKGLTLVACDAGEGPMGAWARDDVAMRETDASDFGTELLVPEAQARRLCEIDRPSLVEVGALARTFDVSLTMAALRFVELSSEACAVVYADGGRVVWSAGGDDFLVRLPGRGERLSAATRAGCGPSSESSGRGLERVDAEAWGDAERDVALWEDALFFGERGDSLTWLWHPAP